jgi:hypothetical protein
MRKIALKVSLLAFVVSSIALYGDWYIETLQTQDAEMEVEKTWVKGSIVKVQSEFTSFVFNTKKETVLFESHRNRIYWKGSFAEFTKGVENARKIMMEKMFADLPPAQRKMMEERMKKAMQSDTLKLKISIKATGDTKTLQKYSCKAYDVYNDSKKVASFYHTDKINPFAEIDFAKIDALMEKMSMGPSSAGYKDSQEYHKYARNGHILLLEEQVEPYLPPKREEVVSLENKDVDPTFFGPSASYKPMSIEEVFLAEFAMDNEDEDDEEMEE